MEIEKWVSELHDDYAESTVASVFATFSAFLNVRARIIPASPCSGIRVTSGEYAPERLVASPVQGLRAAMRLYELGLGLSGFTLCLTDLHTGGWCPEEVRTRCCQCGCLGSVRTSARSSGSQGPDQDADWDTVGRVATNHRGVLRDAAGQPPIPVRVRHTRWRAGHDWDRR